jgi:hypothetical protein
MCYPASKVVDVDADEVALMKTIRMGKLEVESANLQAKRYAIEIASFNTVLAFEESIFGPLSEFCDQSWNDRKLRNVIKFTDSFYSQLEHGQRGQLQITNGESHTKKRKREEDAESSDSN